MTAAAVAAAFEHVEKADEVGVRIGVRVDQRMTHARLCGEMHHIGKAVIAEQRRGAVSLGQIELLETELRKRGELGEAGLLQGGIVIAAEIVDADDAASVLQQPTCDMESDEAGSAGDENGPTGRRAGAHDARQSIVLTVLEPFRAKGNSVPIVRIRRTLLS